MKLLVIHPGHLFSTADVYDGLVWGLRANGATVVEYPLHTALDTAATLTGAALTQGAPLGSLPSEHDLAAAGIPGMALFHQVDAVLAVTGSNLPFAVPLALKRGGILTALLCTETPYAARERADASLYSVVFTHERAALRGGWFHRNSPHAVHYLAHAYHPERHTRDGDRADGGDVCFVGTRFPERAALLDGVDWRGVRLVERSIWPRADEPPAELLAQVTPNAEAAALYRGARIVLNHHRTFAAAEGADAGAPAYAGGAESLGPRAYEVAACGAFQLCDDSRSELNDIFDGAVPTYRAGDSAHLEAQIRHFLALPGTREQYARAAWEAVRPHHWGNRARTVLEVLTTHRMGRLWPAFAPPVPAPQPVQEA